MDKFNEFQMGIKRIVNEIATLKASTEEPGIERTSLPKLVLNLLKMAIIESAGRINFDDNYHLYVELQGMENAITLVEGYLKNYVDIYEVWEKATDKASSINSENKIMGTLTKCIEDVNQKYNVVTHEYQETDKDLNDKEIIVKKSIIYAYPDIEGSWIKNSAVLQYSHMKAGSDHTPGLFNATLNDMVEKESIKRISSKKDFNVLVYSTDPIYRDGITTDTTAKIVSLEGYFISLP
jgi:hypothetical protein